MRFSRTGSAQPQMHARRMGQRFMQLLLGVMLPGLRSDAVLVRALPYGLGAAGYSR